jgi:C1A family cysteine protease
MKQSLILAFVSFANAVENGTFKYMQYIAKMNKSPATIEDFNMRTGLFHATNAFIEEWNANLTNTHTVGHNFLSDWTAEEKKVLTSLGGTSRKAPANVPRHFAEANLVAPSSWNWTAKGVVGAVQNQGSCGNCYAFSSVGAVQSSIAIAHNYTAPGFNTYTGNYFSVQQVTSCS